MNQNLTVFNNSEFGDVRVVTKDGEPWFVGRDVAFALGYVNARDAIGKHVDDEDKGVAKCDTLGGGEQSMTIINESGLYSLVLSSKLESAKAFKRWITHDVIPSIRKNGGYVDNDDLFIATYLPLADENTKNMFKNTLQSIRQLNAENSKLQETVSIQNQQIAEMNPKATYYDVVLQCKDLITISVIAKDYGKTAIWMNQYLHNKRIQYKQGDTWLLYSRYADKGYTMTKTYIETNGLYSNIHTYWTQKGRLFIYELMKQDGYLPIIEQNNRDDFYVEFE